MCEHETVSVHYSGEHYEEECNECGEILIEE